MALYQPAIRQNDVLSKPNPQNSLALNNLPSRNQASYPSQIWNLLHFLQDWDTKQGQPELERLRYRPGQNQAISLVFTANDFVLGIIRVKT